MREKSRVIETEPETQAPSRRDFLKGASLLAASASAASVLASCKNVSNSMASLGGGGVIAETTNGKVRGANEDGVKVFKGIHYGGDTSGKNRFMPPTKPASWTGVKDALNWGNVAPQPISSGRYDYTKMIDWMNQPGGQGEDCLVLNVWTRGLKDGAKRPVLLSLHGGGFQTGTSGNPGYNGQPLAKFADVVVVTINHRLGCLGYLYLADLGAPPEFATSGVVGMMDCVAALEWVRDNIANFGGDPGNVMIFGQSGGGAKTATLMAMNSAKGLFHRAGIQSGSALNSQTREAGTRSAERMLARLGFVKSRLRELQDVPFEMLVSAQGILAADAQPATYAPVVDGTVITRHPFTPDAPGVSADVPVIVSTTLEDAALGRTDFDLDDAGLRREVEAIAGGQADRVINVYRRANPGKSQFLLLCQMLTDRGGKASADTLCERKIALRKAPAYQYLFSWPSPGSGGKFGAVHGTDVPLVFHNVHAQGVTGTGPVAQKLADQLAGAWVAFAKTGDPNHPGIPKWPAYDLATRPTLVIAEESKVENDPRKEFRELWQSIPAPAGAPGTPGAPTAPPPRPNPLPPPPGGGRGGRGGPGPRGDGRGGARGNT